ncbi:hypothetical protein [Humidisolicoccus flavus]|uniref:hypothetical protein n=1 Tax=Humidisolicoccus flavus TaxID=3111414 RepID=UPI00324A9E65
MTLTTQLQHVCILVTRETEAKFGNRPWSLDQIRTACAKTVAVEHPETFGVVTSLLNYRDSRALAPNPLESPEEALQAAFGPSWKLVCAVYGAAVLLTPRQAASIIALHREQAESHGALARSIRLAEASLRDAFESTQLRDCAARSANLAFTYFAPTRVNDNAEQLRLAAALSQTKQAVAVSHNIGNGEFTRERFDALTAPWVSTMGKFSRLPLAA